MFLTGPKEKKVCVCVSERERLDQGEDGVCVCERLDQEDGVCVCVCVRDWTTEKTECVCVCV